MAWDNRVDSGHELAPLVADRMEIRVADAAEQDFNLNVVFGWVATRDRCGGKRRCRTPSGVSLRVVHNLCSCYFPFRPLAYSGLVLSVADLSHPLGGLAVK